MRGRLLSLNNYYYRRGGAESLMFAHDTLFRQHGWETAVFSMQHSQNLDSAWREYFVDELELGQPYSAWRKLVMSGKTIYSWEARSKLRRLLDRFRPDVAHAHNIYHHISPSVLGLLRERGVPTVMTAHDLKLACPAYKMLNRRGICERCKNGNLLHVVVNRCLHDSLAISSLVALESGIHRLLGLYRNNLERIVVPSQFYRDKLVEWGWSADRIVLIRNYIRAGDFQANYAPGNYFLYFGRLAAEKGLRTLVSAAAAARVTLRIVGTGPEENEIRRLAEAHPGIEFYGHQTGESLWSMVRGARAVVLPSEWYENAPISLLESYSSGKPVIGARIGGIPEMIMDDETGFLFDSGRSAALQSCLRRVQDMPDSMLADMGRRARDYVEQGFTERHYFEQMAALYHALGAGTVGARIDR